MRWNRIALFCLVGLAAAGCRSDPAVALLERENRQLEDMIFQQQDIIEGYRRGAEGDLRQGPSLAPPAQSGPPPRDRLSLPTVEMPPEAMQLDPNGDASGGSNPAPETSSGPREEEAPRFLPPSDDSQSLDMQGPMPSFQTANPGATRITVRQLPGSAQGPGQTAEETGINLLVEPRDAGGRLVVEAAPISVVVLDPALAGEAARVARWDFTARQVAAANAQTPRGEGIHLQAAWPGKPPSHSRLRLYVRYITNDGRKLEAEQPIDVALAAQQDTTRVTSTRTGTNWQTRTPSPQTRPSSEKQPQTSAALTRRPASRPAWSPDRPDNL